MAKEGSIAPKERINIKYVPATGDQQAEVELPMKIVVLGDLTGRPDETPLEERANINVDKYNFESVLEEANLKRSFSVADRLSGEADAELAVDLEFKKLSDFGTEAVAAQVPELKQLTDLREALVALKGPMGNMPQFRKNLQNLLKDEEARAKLLAELDASAAAHAATDAAAAEAAKAADADATSPDGEEE